MIDPRHKAALEAAGEDHTASYGTDQEAEQRMADIEKCPGFKEGGAECDCPAAHEVTA